VVPRRPQTTTGRNSGNAGQHEARMRDVKKRVRKQGQCGKGEDPGKTIQNRRGSGEKVEKRNTPQVDKCSTNLVSKKRKGKPTKMPYNANTNPSLLKGEYDHTTHTQ